MYVDLESRSYEERKKMKISTFALYRAKRDCQLHKDNSVFYFQSFQKRLVLENFM